MDKLKMNMHIACNKESILPKQQKLISKKNGSGKFSSFTLNISLKEAREAGLVDEYDRPYALKKQITNGKLVISRGYPQTTKEINEVIQDFGLIGRRLSEKTLLDLLYFIERQ